MDENTTGQPNVARNVSVTRHLALPFVAEGGDEIDHAKGSMATAADATFAAMAGAAEAAKKEGYTGEALAKKRAELAADARKKLNEATARARSAEGRANELRSELFSASFAKTRPSDKPGEIALRQEIRSRLASMDPMQRKLAIERAARSVDVLVLSAVEEAAASGFLRVLAEDELIAMRETAARVISPEVAKKLEDVESVARFGKTVRGAFAQKAKALGFDLGADE